MQSHTEEDLVRRIEQDLRATGFDPVTLLPVTSCFPPDPRQSMGWHVVSNPSQLMGTLSLPAPTLPSVISAPVPWVMDAPASQPPVSVRTSTHVSSMLPQSAKPKKQRKRRVNVAEAVKEKAKKRERLRKRKSVTENSIPETSVGLSTTTRMLAPKPSNLPPTTLPTMNPPDNITFAQATELLINHYDSDLSMNVFANSEIEKKFKVNLHRKLIPQIFQKLSSNSDPNALIHHDVLTSYALVIYPLLGFYSYNAADPNPFRN